jgi:hypothetical protein
MGRKTQKIAHFGLFWHFLPTFRVFGDFLTNKASDERVGEVPLFWMKGGYTPPPPLFWPVVNYVLYALVWIMFIKQ